MNRKAFFIRCGNRRNPVDPQATAHDHVTLLYSKTALWLYAQVSFDLEDRIGCSFVIRSDPIHIA